MKRIAVFGMGYVGCVTAACLSRDGHRVIGVDVDAGKIAELNAGRPTVAEPGLERIVSEAVAAGNLRATDRADEAVADSEMALIAVGTPSSPDGDVSTDGVERVIDRIGDCLRQTGGNYTVVVRSTLLPGILEERLAPRLADRAGRGPEGGVLLCNNPEFLRESSAVRDYDGPPFVVVGADDRRASDDVLAMYDRIPAEVERIVTDTRTAALVKYACNAFHALKVAFANEVGSLARSFGADGHEVMAMVCRDRKLNIAPAYLRPGFAFGGSCLPKDLRAVIRHGERNALRLGLLDAILASNEAQLQRALKRVQESGHRRIGLVGLSFKAGTDDLRESPQVILAETLLGRGFDLKIYDPGVLVSRLRGRNLAYVDQHLPHLAALLVREPQEMLDHAEMLVLGTDVANELDWTGCFDGAILDLRRDLARPDRASSATVGRA